MTGLADQDRRQRIALLAILALGSVLLWQTQFGALMLYPFTILATWFHEMGHGIAAMATGASFDHLRIFADGSGVALTAREGGQSRLADAIVAAGGPLGPPLAGAGLILASRNREATRRALAVLGVVLIVSTLVWVRSFIGWLILPAMGLIILALAAKASPALQRFAVQFLGVQACISTWQQTGYLFSEGGVIGGSAQRSDTGAIAELLWLPYWFWGAAISALILALLYWSLRRALGR